MNPDEGAAALHRAAEGGHVACIKLLLENGYVTPVDASSADCIERWRNCLPHTHTPRARRALESSRKFGDTGMFGEVLWPERSRLSAATYELPFSLSRA